MALAQLYILEGNESKPGDLRFLERTNTHVLLGNDSIGKKYSVSLNGDHAVGYHYSPFYEKYVQSNFGTEEVQNSFQDENGVIWHTGKNGFLLGCTFCVTDKNLGADSPETYFHINLDGTLAGISVPRDSDHVTLEGSYELGFFKGGFKLPKLSFPKISLPKVSLPKIKLPKFKLPKLQIPKIKMPKIDTSGISKSISSVGKNIGKIGSKIGKAVDTHMQKIGEVGTKIGEVATSIVDTGLNLVSNLAQGMGPGGGQAQPEEEQAGDPSQPGYEDEQGYTASDGMYYLHDGSGYMNPQTEEWFNMDGSPYGEVSQPSSYNEIGYQDANGYTAEDGMYYLNDGSGFLNPNTNEWFNMDGLPYGENLGFDFSSLTSLISSPAAGAALNTVIPGAGIALPLVSQLLTTGQNKANPTRTTVSIKAPPQKTAVQTTRQVAPPPPPARTAVASRNLSSTQSIEELIKSITQPQTPVKEESKDKTMYWMLGGLGAVYVGSQFLKGNRRR